MKTTAKLEFILLMTIIIVISSNTNNSSSIEGCWVSLNQNNQLENYLLIGKEKLYCSFALSPSGCQSTYYQKLQMGGICQKLLIGSPEDLQRHRGQIINVLTTAPKRYLLVKASNHQVYYQKATVQTFLLLLLKVHLDN